MSDPEPGEKTPRGAGTGMQQTAEIVSLREDVSSLSAQLGQLTMLVSELVRKKEEPSDAGIGAAGSVAGVGDADRGSEDLAAADSASLGGAPQVGSAQDETYLRNSFRESGPDGRHSGEAGNYVPHQVRVAAAHQGGFGGTAAGGAAAGYAGGFGVPIVGAAYQSVKIHSALVQRKPEEL